MNLKWNGCYDSETADACGMLLCVAKNSWSGKFAATISGMSVPGEFDDLEDAKDAAECHLAALAERILRKLRRDHNQPKEPATPEQQ